MHANDKLTFFLKFSLLFFPSVLSPSLLSCPNVETVVTYAHDIAGNSGKNDHFFFLIYKIVIVSGHCGETGGAISRLIYHSSNSETRPTAAASFPQT
jgi:hypothetical protein